MGTLANRRNSKKRRTAAAQQNQARPARQPQRQLAPPKVRDESALVEEELTLAAEDIPDVPSVPDDLSRTLAIPQPDDDAELESNDDVSDKELEAARSADDDLRAALDLVRPLLPDI